MEDLSSLADGSLAATSQAAGNRVSSNRAAMTAPGSMPAVPLPSDYDQNCPELQESPQIPPGYTGKPEPRAAASWNPPHPAWAPAAHPGVTRTPAPVPPDPEPG